VGLPGSADPAGVLPDGSGEVVLVEDLPGNMRLQSLLAAVRDSFGQE